MKSDILLISVIAISVILAGCLGEDKDSDLDDRNPSDPGDDNPKINDTETDDNKTSDYFIHENITVTIFWIGEEAKAENGWIPNTKSAWDDKWMEHFGGVDDPDDRNGYLPAGFNPLQNPFYFSLPYNDFSGSIRKTEAYDIIPWSDSKAWGKSDSMCKNQWIKVIGDDKTAFMQWEDAGPFWEDDSNYVFGGNRPKGEKDDIAGLDVSPAVRDYLGLEDYDKIHWQFVDPADVPDGPWKEIVTTQQTYWE